MISLGGFLLLGAVTAAAAEARRAVSSLSSEALATEERNAKAEDAGFIDAADIERIAFRRLMGLPIPEEYYEKCHYWINSVRAREGLPALRRWREFESCTDDMAEYDYYQYRDFGRPHAALRDRKGCDFHGTRGLFFWNQNSCPLWPNSVNTIRDCTKFMWDEKTSPGVDRRTLGCKSRDLGWGTCGHYYALRGGTRAGQYNMYDRVACGFYVDARDGELYVNQNFGGGDEFLCGGGTDTRPTGDWTVDDCTVPSPDYSGCANLPGIVSPDYRVGGCGEGSCGTPSGDSCANQIDNHTPASPFPAPSPVPEPAPVATPAPRPVTPAPESEEEEEPVGTPAPRPTDCDPDWTGPCEDRRYQGVNVCNILRIGQPNQRGNCDGYFTWSADTLLMTVDYCRASCQRCACANPAPAPEPEPAPEVTPAPEPAEEPERVPATLAPRPSPASQCDPDWTGPCEDRRYQGTDVCKILRIGQPNQRVACDSYFTWNPETLLMVVDYCRAGCQLCACEEDEAPAPAPVPDPASEPEETPAPAPVSDPALEPEQTPSPERPTVPAPVPEPDMPAPEPTNDEEEEGPTEASESSSEEDDSSGPAPRSCEVLRFPGRPNGPKMKINGAMRSACQCEAACADFASEAFVFQPKRGRCWCMAKLQFHNDGSVKFESKKAYQFGLVEAVQQ